MLPLAQAGRGRAVPLLPPAPCSCAHPAPAPSSPPGGAWCRWSSQCSLHGAVPPTPCCIHSRCTPGAPRRAAEAILLQGSNKLPGRQSRRPWAAHGRAAALHIQGCYHRLGEVQGRGVSTHVRCAHLQREGNISTAGLSPPRPSEAPLGVPSAGAGAMGTAVGAGGRWRILPASCSISPLDFFNLFFFAAVSDTAAVGVCAVLGVLPQASAVTSTFPPALSPPPGGCWWLQRKGGTSPAPRGLW